MRRAFLPGICWLALVAAARAGGPLVYGVDGPVVWDGATPIRYRVDRGPLRPPASEDDAGIDEPAARRLVQEAFAVWAAVPGIQLRLDVPGTLPGDVATKADYLNLRGDDGSGSWVVFDQEGRILDELYGAGQSDLILGFAAPIRDGGRIGRFVSLMNGKLAASADRFRPTLVHELGHGLGLDHSQIQWGLASDGDPGNDAAVPVMFPTSTDSEDLATPPQRPLHADDAAWLSWMYRRSLDDFHSRFGRIGGVVKLKSSGLPVRGANVVAVDQSDPVNRRFSCVSDYLGAGTGAFSIPVPPGSYRLLIEPIRAGFENGSSVGPYADSGSDPSFSQRVAPRQFDRVFEVGLGPEDGIVLEAELQP